MLTPLHLGPDHMGHIAVCAAQIVFFIPPDSQDIHRKLLNGFRDSWCNWFLSPFSRNLCSFALRHCICCVFVDFNIESIYAIFSDTSSIESHQVSLLHHYCAHPRISNTHAQFDEFLGLSWFSEGNFDNMHRWLIFAHKPFIFVTRCIFCKCLVKSASLTHVRSLMLGRSTSFEADAWELRVFGESAIRASE